ncbi:hypothetical protein IJF93_02195 [Candidatus Saccharibacteria bacterium]|nr:hypothetical protein [Candidatus Saccharibacteria bacterium]
MKLKLQSGYYVQKYDIAFVLREAPQIPEGMKKVIFQEEDKFIIKRTRDNFQFVGPFSDAETIAWLDERKWIVDYDQYVGISVKVLQREIKKASKGIQSFVCAFDRMPDREYLRPHFEAELACEEHYLQSLKILRDHRDWKLEFPFPEDYKPTPHSAKEKGFFARFFDRAP